MKLSLLLLNVDVVNTYTKKDNAMQLLNTIKNKVQSIDKTKLVQKIGYSATAKGINTLEKLLKSEDVKIWLRESHYDLVNDSTSFLEKLCKVLEINDVFYESEIKNAKIYNADFLKLQEGYIFINTDFKRTTQPIHVLAFCESFRRLSLSNIDELVGKELDEIFEIISPYIKNHYINVEGQAGIWGEIKNYIVHLYDRTYLFGTDGIFLYECNSIGESKAGLRI